MNRRQLIVLFVGIAGLVEWYLATENIDYPIYIRPAVGIIAAAIIGGVTYMLRDKNESRDEEKRDD